MTALLIDPQAKTVTRVNVEGEFLEGVAALIDAPNVTVLVVAGVYALFVDNLGLLKKGAGYWRWKDSDQRIAGKALLTLIGADGLPSFVPETLTPDQVEAGVRWCAEDELERIEQFIVPVPDDEGRFLMPTIQRRPIWKGPPPVIEAEAHNQDPVIWTVHEDERGRFRAVAKTLAGTDWVVSDTLTGLTIEAVREQLPPGLIRKLPEDDEVDETVVERWA